MAVYCPCQFDMGRTGAIHLQDCLLSCGKISRFGIGFSYSHGSLLRRKLKWVERPRLKLVVSAELSNAFSVNVGLDSQGYNVRAQMRSTWCTFSAFSLHQHYCSVSYAYNRSIHISSVSSYHKINHPSSGTNGVCKHTLFSSSCSGRGACILKHRKSLRYRFQVYASLDVASAVDVINDLGLDTLTFLAVTVLIVPAFKTIKASPILGFFFAGVVLNQFGLIRNITDVKVLSEWGILFLLFEMGLELSLARLKALAKFAFGMGLTQVVLSTLAFTSFELPPNDATGTKILEFLFHSRPDLVYGQRRFMRQDDMVEGALVVSHKTQSKGKFLKNYPPCQHCGKNGHPHINVGRDQMHNARSPNNLVMML